MAPRSLDSNLYGSDDCGMADSISADALTPEHTVDIADHWGSIQDERAIAKANVGEESTGPDAPKTPVLDGSRHGTLAGGGDHEGLTDPYPQMGRFPRHVPGPKTSTDEGGGVKTPPPANQLATRKGGSPKP